MNQYIKLIAILLLPLAFFLFRSQASFLQEEDATEEDTVAMTVLPSDTLSHRILFFGDSMVEGLLRRLSDYAEAGGHELTNVVWYSSTTGTWAETDTLSYFIDLVQPTFVFISLGANEQFVKDLNKCERHIRHILHLVGPTPYVWIGTPSWKGDTGINDLTERLVGSGRYYDSRGLTLQRGSDGIHPTFRAAAAWMDSIVCWMNNTGLPHPDFETKHDSVERPCRTFTLQPTR